MNKTRYRIKEIGKDFGDAPFGTALKTKDYRQQGIPIIQGKNIVDQVFEWNRPLYTSIEKFNSLTRSHCKAGDLVFPKIGNRTVGSCAIAKPIEGHSTFLLSTNMMKMSVNHDLADLKFVYYYFCQSHIRQKIISEAGGGAQPIFNFTSLKKFEIELPELPVQRRIADILSAYDDLIENNARRIHVLEQMAQAIYQEWFGKVNKESLPKGWELVTVRDVSTYINRGVSPKYDDNSASTVINQKCIRNERLNLGLARRHSTKLHQDKYVRFGDVLVNSTGIGTLGRVAQVYQEIPDCTVDSHVSIVRPNEKVSIDYYGFYLLTLQPLFDSLGTGSTGQTELARETIANADFVLPPKNLQDKFSEIISPLRKQTNVLTAKNANLRQTRDLLLPRLVSGEVEV